MLTNLQHDTLLSMLTYCRPAGGPTEQVFRAKYILPLPGAWEDIYGNIHVQVDDTRVLWTCHTDTVHWQDGRQRVKTANDIAMQHRKAKQSNCLGADDTAGCFIMREMILTRTPGYYIFHWGEERGGIGSGDLAHAHGDWLQERFDCAIALDRRGTSDIITHQGGRCASDAFALSLARALNTAGLAYAPAEGIFTDTANYTDYIPECTNLSVGYAHEHTHVEWLDLRHVGQLLHALQRLDTRTLDIARTLGEDDDPWRDDRYDDHRRYDFYLDPDWEAIQRTLEAEERQRAQLGIILAHPSRQIQKLP